MIQTKGGVKMFEKDMAALAEAKKKEREPETRLEAAIDEAFGQARQKIQHEKEMHKAWQTVSSNLKEG